jgi:hypothetical protein
MFTDPKIEVYCYDCKDEGRAKHMQTEIDHLRGTIR